MSEFYYEQTQEDEIRQIKCEALRGETNKQLDQLSPTFNTSSKEEKSAMILKMLVGFIGQMRSKPDRLTELKRKDLRDDGWIDSDISILEEEIEKRQ